MLVGIVGTTSSGKKTIASYLITRYKFTQLFIKPSGSDSKDSFKSLAEAVQYATSHWQERFVILSIDHYSNYGIALKRPFFLLIYVDAPVSIRYARSLSRLSTDKSSQKSTDSKIVVDLERFILRDETQLYTPFGHQIGDCLAKLLFNHQSCLYDFHNIADIRLLNNSTNCKELYMKIDDLDLLNPERLRPGWDTYFMALCELASKRSNCMKRRVGCIIVADARVISTGYNGTPRGLKNCSDGGCLRCNQNTQCGSNLDHCICMHAEENALLEAGRERLTNKQVTLYCNTCPCLGCAKKIIQVGVSEVVYAQDYGLDRLSATLFKEAGIKFRQICHKSVQIQ